MMKYIAIFIYLFLILLIQINQHQAIPMYLSSRRDTRKYPLSWYHTNNDFEDRQHHRSIDRHYKRVFNDLLSVQRERRFGNTKYGRSLPTE
jgi:hypothetical protein